MVTAVVSAPAELRYAVLLPVANMVNFYLLQFSSKERHFKVTERISTGILHQRCAETRPVSPIGLCCQLNWAPDDALEMSTYKVFLNTIEKTMKHF